MQQQLHHDQRVYTEGKWSSLSTPLCARCSVGGSASSIYHAAVHRKTSSPTAPTADCSALCFTADTTQAPRSLASPLCSHQQTKNKNLSATQLIHYPKKINEQKKRTRFLLKKKKNPSCACANTDDEKSVEKGKKKSRNPFSCMSK